MKPGPIYKFYLSHPKHGLQTQSQEKLALSPRLVFMVAVSDPPSRRNGQSGQKAEATLVFRTPGPEKEIHLSRECFEVHRGCTGEFFHGKLSINTQCPIVLADYKKP